MNHGILRIGLRFRLGGLSMASINLLIFYRTQANGPGKYEMDGQKSLIKK
jgi:hypothetical protein